MEMKTISIGTTEKNVVRKHYLTDIAFWVVFMATMTFFSLGSHPAFAVLTSLLFMGLGVVLWIRNYNAAKENGNLAISLPEFIFQLFFKLLIIVSVVFCVGRYPGSGYITLAASLLVWAYVIMAVRRRRLHEVAYAISVLQTVIVSADRFL